TFAFALPRAPSRLPLSALFLNRTITSPWTYAPFGPAAARGPAANARTRPSTTTPTAATRTAATLTGTSWNFDIDDLQSPGAGLLRRGRARQHTRPARTIKPAGDRARCELARRRPPGRRRVLR